MSRNCFNCGYCKEKENNSYYCDDLDCEIDPCEPICSDEYYNS